jgi:hypothetical protein
MEAYLGRYAGLLLYLKEMDESMYSRFCGVREFQYLQLLLTNLSQGILLRHERTSQKTDGEFTVDLRWTAEKDAR